MDQVSKIVRSLASDVASPFAKDVLAALDAEDWLGLQKLKPQPGNYTDPESLRKDLLVGELLRKADLPTGVDKRQKAVDTFWLCEHQCCQTNIRLSPFVHNEVSSPSDESVHLFLERVRQEIRHCLRGIPPSLTPRFSSGATYSDKGKLTTIPDKMSSIPTRYSSIDEGFLENSFWPTQWGHLVRDRGQSPRVVRGNIFFTVPKDGSKDRGCAKEASIAVSLQLAAARELRKGLSRFGIDLRTGKETHMRLAREGSAQGHLATFDLSNASDTVSRSIVKLLLPEDWYTLLDSLRAKSTRIDGKWVQLEKFSSMGNGFTFELETLIFCSLARECCRLSDVDPELVRVFGDDIIIPVEASRLLTAVLTFFGFTINKEKTFLAGSFRESCGGDYFDGQDVRGLYLEEVPREPHQWISLHNKLCGHSREGARAARLIRGFVPRDVWRCRGPSTLGDLVFHDTSEASWIKRGDATEPRSWEFRTWCPVPIIIDWNHWKPGVVLASALLGLPSRGVTPRGGVSGYKFSWVTNPGNNWLPE